MATRTSTGKQVILVLHFLILSRHELLLPKTPFWRLNNCYNHYATSISTENKEEYSNCLKTMNVFLVVSEIQLLDEE